MRNLILLLVLLQGCKVIIEDEPEVGSCQDVVTLEAYSSYGFNVHSGKSCSYFDQMKYQYETCDDGYIVDAEAGLSDVHMSSDSQISTINYINPNIKEAGSFDYNNQYIIIASDYKIQVSEQSGNFSYLYPELSDINVILDHEKLYVLGKDYSTHKSYIQVYNLSANKILHETTVPALYNSKMALKNNTLLYYGSLSSLPSDFNCEEIIYLSDNKSNSLSVFYEFNPESLKVQNKKIYHGYQYFYLGEDQNYLSSSNYGQNILMNIGSEDFAIMGGYIYSTLGFKEDKDQILFFRKDGDDNIFTKLNKDLSVHSEISNIAYGENITAVRFKEQRAYVATYEYVDPVFIIDFSKANAEIIGEYKFDGSTGYIHPLSDNKVLSFNRSFLSSLKKEINLIDPAQNTVLASYILEHESYFFDLFYDYKALTQYGEYIFIKEERSVYVLKITDKIEFVGKISTSSTENAVLGFDNELRILDGYQLRRFDLEDGLREIENEFEYL